VTNPPIDEVARALDLYPMPGLSIPSKVAPPHFAVNSLPGSPHFHFLALHRGDSDPSQPIGIRQSQPALQASKHAGTALHLKNYLNGSHILGSKSPLYKWTANDGVYTVQDKNEKPP